MKNIHYITLYATFWILILNLIISNRLPHLLLLPLIIFGNYLVLTRYKKAMSFYEISFTLLMVANIVFHIILPIYIIQKEELTYQFNINSGNKNLKKYLIPVLLLLLLYKFLIPINTIYFMKKNTFFNIALLLFIIGCFILV